jgi:pimeloyl-ACP methyl ester carboxylesterase
VLRRLAAVVLGALALLAGCGGGNDKPTAKRTPVSEVSGVDGKLVDIGGGRSLFVNCAGKGEPLVVLEAGLGGNAHGWDYVAPDISRFTRTCAYDRAGLGSSVAPQGVRDADDDVADLQKLVDALGGGPVVMVGHSYGGLLARLFASRNPQAVAAVVLVDAMGRDQTRRELALWPKSQARTLRRRFERRVIDNLNLAKSEALAQHVDSLGETPLVVVTAGNHDDLQGLPPKIARRLYRLWTTMQDELAALSPDSVHVVARDSDHFIQTPEGQPDVVVNAVRAAVEAARTNAPLPECRQLFSGAGVRCR